MSSVEQQGGRAEEKGGARRASVRSPWGANGDEAERCEREQESPLHAERRPFQ